MADDTDPHGYEPNFDPYTPPPGRREPGDAAPEDADEQLRGRLERVDHKLGVRSYAGGLAIVIALAGAIVAIVLALGARDESATKNQLQSLKTEVLQAAGEANKATDKKVESLSGQVDAISGSIDELRSTESATASQVDGIQGDLDDLKGQISDLESSQDSSGSSGGVGAGSSGGLGEKLRNALGGN